MRNPRSFSVAASAVTITALALTGCAAVEEASRAPRSVAQAGSLAASVAETKCKDGANQVASIAPGSITADPASITESATLDRIRKRKRLIVGTSGDVLLWGATDPKTGDLQGYDIELAEEIAKRLGVKPTYKVITYGARLSDLENNSVDLVSHTMTINCARWEGAGNNKAPVNFSFEYFRAGQRVLVRIDSKFKEVEELKGKGKKVCVPAASTNVDNIKALGFTDDELEETTIVGDCLVKFQEGEVDAITGDDTVLAGFAAQDDYAKIIGRKFSEEPYGLGVNKGDDQFTQFVNAVLVELRDDGTLTRIYNRTMGQAIPGGAPAVPAFVTGRVPERLGGRP